MRLLTNMAEVLVVKAKGVVKKLGSSGWNLSSYIDEREAVNYLRISVNQGCFQVTQDVVCTGVQLLQYAFIATELTNY
jgi:hypothetical protein